MNRPIDWRWCGRVAFGDARQMQLERRRAVIEGTAPEVIWLLEHEPVITTGRRPVAGLPSADALEKRGLAVVRTERGGLATFHGPGQLIAYAIIDAGTRKIGVRGLICAMESGVIATVSELGIAAHRRDGFPGVWVGTAKICAIGMHFRRGVSMHGIALNLDPDLDGFGMIVPCGITDGAISSVAQLRGSAPAPTDLAPILAGHLIDAIAAASSRRTGAQTEMLTASGPSDSSRPLAGT
jgi:lipoyl(octanoyl) transferase